MWLCYLTGLHSCANAESHLVSRRIVQKIRQGPLQAPSGSGVYHSAHLPLARAQSQSSDLIAREAGKCNLSAGPGRRKGVGGHRDTVLEYIQTCAYMCTHMFLEGDIRSKTT